MKPVERNELKVESAVEGRAWPLQNAEIQLGYTALLEGFRNFWLNQGATYQEVRLFTGVEPKLFVEVGWLKKTTEQYNQCYFPDGALALQLARDADPSTLDSDPSQPSSEPIHVSTHPFPHVVPTTPERATARQAQSGSSSGIEAGSAATGDEVQTDAAANGPSIAIRRGGRWDGNPVESGKELRVEGKPTGELRYAIGALQVVADSIREDLDQKIEEHNQTGRPTADELEDAVNQLMNLAAGLHRHFLDLQVELQRARFAAQLNKA